MTDTELGATGEFPEGKLCEGDEGELALRVGRAGDQVVMEFGTSVRWLAMNPEQAKELGEQLFRFASALSEGVETMDIVDRLRHEELCGDAVNDAANEIVRLRRQCRRGAQRLIGEIGASGPEHFEDTVERAAERLNVYRRALVALRDMLHLPKTETLPLIEEVLRKETKLLEDWENLQLQRDQGM